MAQSLAIVPVQQDRLPHSQDPVVVKLYCGSKRVPRCKTDPEDSQLFKAPVPAWADLPVVHHMQEAVVPEVAPREAGRKIGGHSLKAEFQSSRCAFRFASITLAVVENVLCYLAYLQARSPSKNFYNKFQAHILAFPDADMALLVIAILNSAYIMIFWIMIALMKLDLYSAMAIGRLVLSLSVGIICSAMIFFSEGTKAWPFFVVACMLLNLILCCCERLRTLPQDGSRIWKVFYKLMIFLLFGWFIAGVVMFVDESKDFLRDDKCPATTNTAMPVRIKGVREWQCVKWEEPHYIRRVPAPTSQPYEALCSTSFHAFTTEVPARLNASAREKLPSSGAHMVRCPAHCQDLNLGTLVNGCKIYNAESSICSAAVQMELTQPNVGGLVKVIGRPPPGAKCKIQVEDGGSCPVSEWGKGNYDRCNRNGILSTEVPAASSLSHPSWAFYFEVPSLKSDDMVTLHGWEKKNTPGARKPWESYRVNVSWVVGGTSRTKMVDLGPGADDAEIEVNFCNSSAKCESNTALYRRWG